MTTPMTLRSQTSSGGVSALSGVLAATSASAVVLWESGDAPVRALQALTLDDPAALVMGCTRLAGLAIALWLLGVTTVALLLRLLGAHLLSRAVTLLLPHALRRVVQLGLGLSLATASLTGPAMAATSAPRPTLAVAGDLTNGQRWPVIPPLPTTTSVRGRISVPAPGRVSLPASTLPSTTRPSTTRPSTTRPDVVRFDPPVPIISAPTITAPAPQVSSTTADEETWTVKAGDHFWSIAERVAHVRQPGATTQDVGRYWLRLIEANRSRLDDPHNPDLLRVGVDLTLPPW